MSIFRKIFGGLPRGYYARQLVFGLIFLALILSMMAQAGLPELSVALVMLINTALYPYSRFVYESVVGFFMGDNVFYANAVILILLKIATMSFCWAAAIFIAPIGLAYLYFNNRKREARPDHN